MITVIQLIETLLYVYLFFSVGYLVLFAVASLFAVKKDLLATDRRHRFLFLIPSYKEDKVIGDTVQAALSQQYPQEYFRVMVISDQMNESTNGHLRSMGAEVLEIHYEESSKALALQSAIRSCQSDAPSDYVVILDADNIIASDYLEQVNRYTQQTQCKVLQTHRTAKNLNTSTAILDAAIEEMNNSIFRKGHIRLGFSSALTGSGMAFDFRWFVRNIIHTHSTGEDKELEELLLRQGIHIEYIDTLETLDEKVRQPDALRNQRRRWIATQLFLALKMGRNLPTALLNGNGDYLLKTLQAFIAPRSILLALIGFFSCVLCIFSPASSIKWWILLILLNGALYLAIPSNMRYKYMSRILRQTPYFVIIMLLNLFHLKGMAQKFNHTQHG